MKKKKSVDHGIGLAERISFPRTKQVFSVFLGVLCGKAVP
jgi:hypothetical protein